MKYKLLQFIIMTCKYSAGIFMIQLLFMVSIMAFDSSAQYRSVRETAVAIQFEDSSIPEVFKAIESLTSYKFYYSKSDIKGSSHLDLKEGTYPVSDVLLKVSEKSGLKFRQVNNNIAVSKISKDLDKETIEIIIEDVIIQGKVTDETGQPIPGATVRHKEGTAGVITDIDGNYSLTVPDNAVLIFSFVGMKTTEIAVGGRSVVDALLQTDTSTLEEVIVTGYQTLSSERFTGSAAVIEEEDIDRRFVTNVQDNLEGMIAGLSLYNGNPVVRGVGTFLAPTENQPNFSEGREATAPLYVVDGLPMESDIKTINPSDIARITLLKDAAATSIYGARAANGVIVIETKRAKLGTTQIEFSADFSFTEKSDLGYFNYAPTSDIIDYEIEYLKNTPEYINDPAGYFADQDGDFTAYSPVYNYFRDVALGNITESEAMDRIDAVRNNDYRNEYQNHIVRASSLQQYNFAIRKANEGMNMSFSANYQKNESGVINNHDDRLNLHFKNSFRPTNWFSFGYGVNGSFSTSQSTTGLNSATNPMPYERLVDDEGNRVSRSLINYQRNEWLKSEGFDTLYYNALDEADRNFRKTSAQNLRAYLNADFKILDGLNYGVMFQYEHRNNESELLQDEESYSMRKMVLDFTEEEEYFPGFFRYVNRIPTGGRLQNDFGSANAYTLRNQLNFSKVFNGKHDITTLIGSEVREDKGETNQSELYGYDPQTLTSIPVDYNTLTFQGVRGLLRPDTRSSIIQYLNNREVMNRYFSAYGNMSYLYDHRFGFTASIRIDQADLFGSDPKFRYRPLWSVGGSWNISQENFLASSTWLNMLKLRTTYGIGGNVDRSSSPFLIAVIGNSWYVDDQYATISNPPNPLLRWEKVSTLNIGVDFALFDGRLSGNLDYYRKYSDDLLATKIYDPTTGFNQGKVNNGAMLNNGIEWALSYNVIGSGPVQWNTRLTGAYNRNEVKRVDFEVEQASDLILRPKDNYLEGRAYNYLYGYRYAGLTADGDPSVYDEEGNVVTGTQITDPDALVPMGQLDPKVNLSLYNAVRIKNFELSAMVMYYGGHKMRNEVTRIYEKIGSGNIHADIARRWTPENTSTDIPRMQTFESSADRWAHWRYADAHIEDASFIALRNVILTYNVPTKVLQKIGASSVRIRVQGNNLKKWTANDKGIDPEAFDATFGNRRSPLMPSWIFGINVGF